MNGGTFMSDFGTLIYREGAWEEDTSALVAKRERWDKNLRRLRYRRKVKIVRERNTGVLVIGGERYLEHSAACDTAAENFANPFGLVLEWVDDLLTVMEEACDYDPEDFEGGVLFTEHVSDAGEQRLLQALRDPKRRKAVEALYRISGPVAAIKCFSKKGAE